MKTLDLNPGTVSSIRKITYNKRSWKISMEDDKGQSFTWRRGRERVSSVFIGDKPLAFATIIARIAGKRLHRQIARAPLVVWVLEHRP